MRVLLEHGCRVRVLVRPDSDLRAIAGPRRINDGTAGAGAIGSWDLCWAHPQRLPGWKVWLLGGLLTMGLDIVIDPLTLRGSEWFLAQIYFYPGGGEYFGVPLSNFAGWALLAWSITGTLLLLERLALQRWFGPWRGYPADALPGLGLYTGILGFNLVMIFSIGAFRPLAASLVVATVLLAPVVLRLKRGEFHTARQLQSEPSAG